MGNVKWYECEILLTRDFEHVTVLMTVVKKKQAYGIIKLLMMFYCSEFINNTCLKGYFLYISLGTTRKSSRFEFKEI